MDGTFEILSAKSWQLLLERTGCAGKVRRVARGSWHATLSVIRGHMHRCPNNRCMRGPGLIQTNNRCCCPPATCVRNRNLITAAKVATMSSFFSGLRSALTRATSYGSATSAQESSQEAVAPTQQKTPKRRSTSPTKKDLKRSASPVKKEPKSARKEVKRSASPVKKDPVVDEDNSVKLEASQIEDAEDHASETTSSRTLSFDESVDTNKEKKTQESIGPSTPRTAGNVATPKTIFQTAQKDIFKSAFKSAAKERDIFMTAKPVRTWHQLNMDNYESSPISPDIDDSSATLSFSQASNTPSIASKRDREEEDNLSTHKTPASASKRRRTLSPKAEEQTLVLPKRTQPTRTVAELDTSALSDSEEETSDSPSSAWSFDTPPPNLDRKARKSWKKQQRHASKSTALQKTKKQRGGVSKKTSRSGFKRSVSGRDILISHARKRFWEGKVAKGVSCY